jgi:hypothetical protein
LTVRVGLGSEAVMERAAASSGVEVLVVPLGEGPLGIGPAQVSDGVDGGSLAGAVEGALAGRPDAEVTQAVAKGVEAIILALGSAGAIAAAVEALRLWLARDRGRRVQLSWTVGGERREVELAADRMSEAGARELLLAALGKPGVAEAAPMSSDAGGVEDG